MDVSNTPLGRLTPEKAGYALLVELSLLRKDKTVFGKFVYDRLTNLRVGDTGYSLNLHECVLDFIELCQNFETTEFAVPTFGSLYRTRDGAFDPNYDLFHHEIPMLVDGANFVQLLKAFITLLQAMHKRFFMTVDPTSTDTSRAVYFIKDGDVKHERRTAAFCDFLHMFQRVYTCFCMISPSKKEVRDIYNEAGSVAKAHSEEMYREKVALQKGKQVKAEHYKKKQQQQKKKQAASTSTAGTATALRTVDSGASCLSTHSVWGRKQTVLPCTELKAEDVVVEATLPEAAAAADSGSESVESAEAAAADSGSESSEEGFTLVQKKQQPKPNPKARFYKRR